MSGLKLSSLAAKVQGPCNSVDYHAGDRPHGPLYLRILATFAHRMNVMRLGYFTMPLHPLERDTTQTLQEDREAIILADQLGFYDAFVGEHIAHGAVGHVHVFEA